MVEYKSSLTRNPEPLNLEPSVQRTTRILCNTLNANLIINIENICQEYFFQFFLLTKLV